MLQSLDMLALEDYPHTTGDILQAGTRMLLTHLRQPMIFSSPLNLQFPHKGHVLRF